MRILIIVLSVLLLGTFAGFVATNFDTKIGVTVWKTHHDDVALYIVVFLSILAGCLFAGIIGVAERTQMWLVNRRQTREIQKLETELNYLRTQPLSRSGSTEIVEQRTEIEPVGNIVEDQQRAPHPSAPVYGDDDDDPDDDIYSGGRAV
jgi:hypothetical protein